MDFLASSFPCHHQSVPTSSPLSPHFPLLPIYFLLGLSLCRMDSVWHCHYNKKGELGERRKKKQAGLGLFHIANRKQGKVLHENNILTLYHIAIHQVYQTEGGVIYYAHIPWCYHFHHTTSKSTTLYTTAIIDVQGKKAIGSFNEKGSHN